MRYQEILLKFDKFTDRSYRRYIKSERGARTTGTVVVLAPTFGRTKDPPMSLKAGKDVWLVDLRTPFLSLTNFHSEIFVVG